MEISELGGRCGNAHRHTPGRHQPHMLLHHAKGEGRQHHARCQRSAPAQLERTRRRLRQARAQKKWRQTGRASEQLRMGRQHRPRKAQGARGCPTANLTALQAATVRLTVSVSVFELMHVVG